MVCVAIDVASLMVGKNKGFVSLLSNVRFPIFVYHHCIIYIKHIASRFKFVPDKMICYCFQLSCSKTS